MRPFHQGLLRWIERLLWISAVGAVVCVLGVLAEGRIYQSYLNSKFDEDIATRQILSYTRDQAKSVPAMVAAESRPSGPLPYIGRLEVPRLRMSVMVLDGVDNRTLRRGAGHIPGTAWPGQAGNVAVAGHRDTFFRALEGIQKNDRISFQMTNGDYEYVVESIRIVEPNAVDVLANPGHPVLTLITCYPFYFVGPAPKRFVVQAHSVSHVQH
jgi:sortase A